MHARISVVLAAALAASSPAQSDPPEPAAKPEAAAAPVPLYPLAAGGHTVDDLLQMLGQVRGRPLTTGPDLLATVGEARFDLQRDLRLSAAEWEDVVSMLLLARGIALMHVGDEVEATALATMETKEMSPTDRAPAEILDRPHRIEFVATRLAPAAGAPLVHMLRPVLAAATSGSGPEVRQDGEEVTVRGLTPHVAFALRVLMLMDDRPLPAAQQPEWPAGKTCAWPGGRMKADELLRLAGAELDANVLWRADHLPGEPLDLGEPAKLTPRAWLAAASTALATVGLEVTILHARQRLLEVLPATREFTNVSWWRTAVLDSEAVLDPELPLQPVLTKVPMPEAGFGVLRGVFAIGRRESRLMLGAGPQAVVLGGPSAIVRDYIGKVATFSK